MKRVLVGLAVASVAVSAQAADMAVRAPYTKAPAAMVYDWSGFYVGVNAGYGWNGTSRIEGDNAVFPDAGNILVNGLNSVNSAAPISLSQRFNSIGAFGGLQAGYNFQFSNAIVGGFEADIQAVGHGSATSMFGTAQARNYPFNGTNDLSWFGTVRGRLGYAVAPSLLLYGTGGLAYGQTRASGAITTDSNVNFVLINSITCVANQVCLSGAQNRTASGWTAGAGAEWAFARNWSLKVEYLHVDLGTSSVQLVAPVAFGNAFATMRLNNAFETVRAGANYRF